MIFYRQKVLLALIEMSGNKLSSTDLEKLLFLFCKYSKQNFYDFFPYKYGAFSFLTYYDKRKLIEKGLLKNCPHFELQPSSKSFLQDIKKEDLETMRKFILGIGNLRGRELVRKAYLDYPEYASRSEISKELLSKDEYLEASSHWKPNNEKLLFTIGYEGKSIDQYLFELLVNNIQVLVDVRKNPFSRKHGFSGKSLREYLRKVDIRYVHLPELGVPSKLRQNLNGKESYHQLFEHYELEILADKQDALEQIEDMIKAKQRIALTCFEADHEMCHRNVVAKHVSANLKENTHSFHI